MGVVFGLDFGAVMAVGAARGVDTELLSEMLPVAESALVAFAINTDQEGMPDG